MWKESYLFYQNNGRFFFPTPSPSPSSSRRESAIRIFFYFTGLVGSNAQMPPPIVHFLSSLTLCIAFSFIFFNILSLQLPLPLLFSLPSPQLSSSSSSFLVFSSLFLSNSFSLFLVAETILFSG